MNYNKYKAKRVTANGHNFASMREAAVAQDLELRKRAGQIIDIQYQPRFVLIPSPNKVTYVADFLVTYPDGRKEVIECKGYWTPIAKIKFKMFKHFYPDVAYQIVY